nr:DNA helicase [Tanacetum cinerariifolium]
MNDVFYPTYRGACEALGLLGDDKEWDIAMQETSLSAMSLELRFVFAHILTHCDVTDPSKLWGKYWPEMGHDIPGKVSERVNISNYHLNDQTLQGYILYELEIILSDCGKSLQHFGLPLPPQDLIDMLANRLRIEEKNYNQQELMQERDKSTPKLNTQQRKIYDLIIDANLKKQQELIFVYGHGGTGKTFLWKTIISTLRSEEKIVLVVASSGIASLLLPSGRTAHSRFKLTLELTEESLFRIIKNRHLGKLLANRSLIIWDEAPINDRRCFEALDRSLRDILTEPHSLFGGKLVLLVFTLSENMHLAKPNISADERNLISSFASWLLDIGDGKTSDPDPEDPENTSWVDIPINYCIPNDEKGLQNLINFIYDQNTLQTPSAVSLQQKSIVCSKNETADMRNSKVLEMVQGETKIYLSRDEARPVDNDGAETEMLYPVEHLNTLKLPGYPPRRASMELSTIAHLTPVYYNKTIDVRLYRKRTAKSLPDLTPTTFCCILIDQEDIDYFDRILQIGFAYRISNFICEPTSSNQQTLENKTSLRFGRFTKFDNIPATTFPCHYFEFTSYNRLESKIPKPDNNNKMQYPVLTDYIGCIRSVSGITHFRDPNRSEKILRKIEIENLKNQTSFVLKTEPLVTTFPGSAHLITDKKSSEEAKETFTSKKVTIGTPIPSPSTTITTWKSQEEDDISHEKNAKRHLILEPSA